MELDTPRKLIERLRSNIAMHVSRLVTLSVGAFEVPVIILNQADHALYYATSNGRNQACPYDELGPDALLHINAASEDAEFF